jgi:wobble nucleotide-excising tRNase
VEAEATEKEKMARKLKSAEGKKIYKKRKETVEPVFGIIKQALGFRQFLLRGLEKVNQEWEIVCLEAVIPALARVKGKREGKAGRIACLIRGQQVSQK